MSEEFDLSDLRSPRVFQRLLDEAGVSPGKYRFVPGRLELLVNTEIKTFDHRSRLTRLDLEIQVIKLRAALAAMHPQVHDKLSPKKETV